MDAMKDSISALSDMFNARMSEFQRELNKGNSPASTATLSSDFSAFKTFIVTALNTLQRQVEFLGREIDRLEMRRRRKMLLLHGLPEDKSEDTSARVTTVVADHLNLGNFSSNSIKASYRLGRPLDNKPRPIVIKFTDAASRDKVWFAKSKLKGTGFTQSEFLTKTRHRVFLEARQRFGVSNCWTRDGCIHIVTPDGVHHRAECIPDLDCISNSSSSQKSPPPVKTAASRVDQKVISPRTKRVVKK
ncbi:uncharacterized protein LOC124542778 [Vanessa cardui]|uniref:uncharacterized protein LOC124542778 n=1 Tax=Vanessa cardui TaxID=171605 RepID=UPI001F130F88|nr:uncharacterized protein LOC124542778 [Vanessa cardui]